MGSVLGHDSVSHSRAMYDDQADRNYSDLLAHHPSAASPTLFMPRSRASSRATSPERIGGIPPMPRTPFTVNSSFDEQWDAARRAVEVSANPDAVTPSVEKRENGVIPGSSGSGMSSTGQLGARVDVKSMKGRRRRGVGPGVTCVPCSTHL